MLRFMLASTGLFCLLIAGIVAADKEWPAMIVMVIVATACFITYRNLGGPLPRPLYLNKRIR